MYNMGDRRIDEQRVSQRKFIGLCTNRKLGTIGSSMYQCKQAMETKSLAVANRPCDCCVRQFWLR